MYLKMCLLLSSCLIFPIYPFLWYVKVNHNSLYLWWACRFYFSKKNFHSTPNLYEECKTSYKTFQSKAKLQWCKDQGNRWWSKYRPWMALLIRQFVDANRSWNQCGFLELISDFKLQNFSGKEIVHYLYLRTSFRLCKLYTANYMERQLVPKGALGIEKR